MEQIKLSRGETVFQRRLENGLMVFVLPKPGFLRTYAALSTHYGSLDSSFEVPGEGVVETPSGIAHFLEHKLFEEEEGSVFERFAAWGASVNAFTSYSQTSYLFSTIENWQESLVELVKFVNRPHLTEENVEKEKGIIVQELQMYADQPSHRILTTLLENLYHQHPVRLDIGGTVDSVQRTTVEDLLRCYRTFYQPGNMALVVVGDVDPQETWDLVQANYPVWDHREHSIKRLLPQEPRGIVQPWAENVLAISRPRYYLGFKHEPRWQGEELVRQQITMSLGLRLIAGRSSPAFGQLYDAGLVDDSFGASFSGHSSYAHSILGGETDEPEALHARLREIIDELKAGGVQEEDVERLKKQFQGQYLASLDSFEFTANRLVAHYFSGSSYHRYLDLLDQVGVEDVQEALASELDWEHSSVSILRPVNSDD